MDGDRHLTALAVKTLMVFGTLLLALRLFGAVPTLGTLLTVTALLVAIGYPLGDLYLLQNGGAAVALAVDTALALGLLWAAGAAWPAARLSWVAVVGGAGALTLAEAFLHRWLQDRVGLRARPGDVEPHEREE